MKVADVTVARLAEVVAFEHLILGTTPVAICALFDDTPTRRALATYLRDGGYPIVASFIHGRAA